MCPNPATWLNLPPESLERASPAVANQLRSFFGEPLPPPLTRAYDEAVSRGALIEPGVVRPEGASFNPRPARILSILLNDCLVREAPVLIAGLEVCGRPFLEESHLASIVRQFLANPAQVDPTPKGRLIAASMVLDTVRHVKLCPDPIPHLAPVEAPLVALLDATANDTIPDQLRNKLLFSARLVAQLSDRGL